MPKFMEDLKVGETFRSPMRVVTESEIIQFAGKYDNQPAHTDIELAKTTMFRGLAASGWHTAAMCFQLVLESGLDLAGGIVGSNIENIVWAKPVRPGDSLYVTSEILSISPSEGNPARGIVRLKHTTYNQADELVMSMIGNVLTSTKPNT
jgi:acyl dehydratase